MSAHIHRSAPPISQHVSGLPAGLIAVIERMLAKQPSERFATPSEVAEAAHGVFPLTDIVAKTEELKGGKIVFDQGRHEDWKEGRLTAEGTYTLDSSTDPKSITFAYSTGQATVNGIYRLTDDQLWIAFHSEGAERPKTLSVGPDSPDNVLIVTRRTEKPVPSGEQRNGDQVSDKPTGVSGRKIVD